jgi:hypothetical protein
MNTAIKLDHQSMFEVGETHSRAFYATCAAKFHLKLLAGQ